jgi:SAM-dependent methyltransferase
MAFLYRDTDRDWQQIGAEEPFWGVVTLPEFRRQALNSQILETFYDSGVLHIAQLNETVTRMFGQGIQARRALDFGCGAGRITHAMVRHAERVVGLDISEGMLEEARARQVPGVEFCSRLGNGRFDWIHSYIVFQHIPPARGMTILRDLLKRLEPGGLVTMHFTVDRSDALKTRNPLRALWRFLFLRFGTRGQVHMYDYNLSALITLLYQFGIRDFTLSSTDHGGHIGVFVIGRRDPASACLVTDKDTV